MLLPGFRCCYICSRCWCAGCLPLVEGTTTYSSSELGLVFLSPGGSATGPLCAALLGLPVLLAVVVGSLVGFLVVLVAMVGAPVLATGPARRIKNVVCDVYKSKNKQQLHRARQLYHLSTHLCSQVLFVRHHPACQGPGSLRRHHHHHHQVHYHCLHRCSRLCLCLSAPQLHCHHYGHDRGRCRCGHGWCGRRRGAGW